MELSANRSLKTSLIEGEITVCETMSSGYTTLPSSAFDVELNKALGTNPVERLTTKQNISIVNAFKIVGCCVSDSHGTTKTHSKPTGKKKGKKKGKSTDTENGWIAEEEIDAIMKQLSGLTRDQLKETHSGVKNLCERLRDIFYQVPHLINGNSKFFFGHLFKSCQDLTPQIAIMNFGTSLTESQFNTHSSLASARSASSGAPNSYSIEESDIAPIHIYQHVHTYLVKKIISGNYSNINIIGAIGFLYGNHGAIRFLTNNNYDGTIRDVVSDFTNPADVHQAYRMSHITGKEFRTGHIFPTQLTHSLGTCFHAMIEYFMRYCYTLFTCQFYQRQPNIDENNKRGNLINVRRVLTNLNPTNELIDSMIEIGTQMFNIRNNAEYSRSIFSSNRLKSLLATVLRSNIVHNAKTSPNQEQVKEMLEYIQNRNSKYHRSPVQGSTSGKNPAITQETESYGSPAKSFNSASNSSSNSGREQSLFKVMLKLLMNESTLIFAKTRSPAEMYAINETVAELLNQPLNSFCDMFGLNDTDKRKVMSHNIKEEADMYIWAQALLDSCCHDFASIPIVPQIGMRAMEELANQAPANFNNKMWCIHEMLKDIIFEPGENANMFELNEDGKFVLDKNGNPQLRINEDKIRTRPFQLPVHLHYLIEKFTPHLLDFTGEKIDPIDASVYRPNIPYLSVIAKDLKGQMPRVLETYAQSALGHLPYANTNVLIELPNKHTYPFAIPSTYVVTDTPHELNIDVSKCLKFISYPSVDAAEVSKSMPREALIFWVGKLKMWVAYDNSTNEFTSIVVKDLGIQPSVMVPQNFYKLHKSFLSDMNNPRDLTGHISRRVKVYKEVLCSNVRDMNFTLCDGQQININYMINSQLMASGYKLNLKNNEDLLQLLYSLKNTSKTSGESRAILDYYERNHHEIEQFVRNNLNSSDFLRELETYYPGTRKSAYKGIVHEIINYFYRERDNLTDIFCLESPNESSPNSTSNDILWFLKLIVSREPINGVSSIEVPLNIDLHILKEALEYCGATIYDTRFIVWLIMTQFNRRDNSRDLGLITEACLIIDYKNKCLLFEQYSSIASEVIIPEEQKSGYYEALRVIDGIFVLQKSKDGTIDFDYYTKCLNVEPNEDISSIFEETFDILETLETGESSKKLEIIQNFQKQRRVNEAETQRQQAELEDELKTEREPQKLASKPTLGQRFTMYRRVGQGNKEPLHSIPISLGAESPPPAPAHTYSSARGTGAKVNTYSPSSYASPPPGHSTSTSSRQVRGPPLYLSPRKNQRTIEEQASLAVHNMLHKRGYTPGSEEYEEWYPNILSEMQNHMHSNSDSRSRTHTLPIPSSFEQTHAHHHSQGTKQQSHRKLSPYAKRAARLAADDSNNNDPHTHTLAHTRTRAPAHTHSHAHTHTHSHAPASTGMDAFLADDFESVTPMTAIRPRSQKPNTKQNPVRTQPQSQETVSQANYNALLRMLQETQAKLNAHKRKEAARIRAEQEAAMIREEEAARIREEQAQKVKTKLSTKTKGNKLVKHDVPKHPTITKHRIRAQPKANAQENLRKALKKSEEAPISNREKRLARRTKKKIEQSAQRNKEEAAMARANAQEESKLNKYWKDLFIINQLYQSAKKAYNKQDYFYAQKLLRLTNSLGKDYENDENYQAVNTEIEKLQKNIDAKNLDFTNNELNTITTRAEHLKNELKANVNSLTIEFIKQTILQRGKRKKVTKGGDGTNRRGGKIRHKITLKKKRKKIEMKKKHNSRKNKIKLKVNNKKSNKKITLK